MDPRSERRTATQVHPMVLGSTVRHRAPPSVSFLRMDSPHDNILCNPICNDNSRNSALTQPPPLPHLQGPDNGPASFSVIDPETDFAVKTLTQVVGGSMAIAAAAQRRAPARHQVYIFGMVLLFVLLIFCLIKEGYRDYREHSLRELQLRLGRPDLPPVPLPQPPTHPPRQAPTKSCEGVSKIPKNLALDECEQAEDEAGCVQSRVVAALDPGTFPAVRSIWKETSDAGLEGNKRLAYFACRAMGSTYWDKLDLESVD